MKGEAKFPRDMGPAGHQVALEQIQQRRDLGLVVSADINPGLQR